MLTSTHIVFWIFLYSTIFCICMECCFHQNWMVLVSSWFGSNFSLRKNLTACYCCRSRLWICYAVVSLHLSVSIFSCVHACVAQTSFSFTRTTVFFLMQSWQKGCAKHYEVESQISKWTIFEKKCFLWGVNLESTCIELPKLLPKPKTWPISVEKLPQPSFYIYYTCRSKSILQSIIPPSHISMTGRR